MAQRASPARNQLRNTLLLWGGLLALISAVWAFERHSRGYTAGQILGDVPWLWIVAGICALLGVRWLATRRLSAEVEQVLSRVARDRAVCRHCGQPVKTQAITCSSCGRVVEWGGLIGAVLAVLVLLGLLIRGAFLAE